MFFVYVIQSEKKGNFYKGQTENLKKRLQAHNSGKTKSTKYGVPWKLVYYETVETREMALKKSNKKQLLGIKIIFDTFVR